MKTEMVVKLEPGFQVRDDSVDMFAATGHSFGEWKIRRAPSKRFEGEKARNCTVCGYSEKQIIPRLPEPSGRSVTLIEFLEILKFRIDDFIARIAERNGYSVQ